MSDSTFSDRVARLAEIRLAERRAQIPHETAAIAARMATRGLVQSSAHVFALQGLYARELEVRAIIVWETLVRVHRTLGSIALQESRESFRTRFNEYLASVHRELSAQLSEGASRFGSGMKVDLIEAYQLVLGKHDVEIDLYFDSLASANATGVATSMSYNFYGNVGAVQTGAQSVANVVQSLGTSDREALDAALRQVAEALNAAPRLAEAQRSDLLEIARECEQQLKSPTPNNTKLLTMFNVLATAVQGIASAQPAYQALKLALLPLGITLP
jgi:hypothetical protein